MVSTVASGRRLSMQSLHVSKYMLVMSGGDSAVCISSSVLVIFIT